ncbi:hypothetical protein HNY73_004415 [Argiope bruennichi]|uniref:RAD51 interacting motif domain-containing protein n=1 Tax=Argiope bruennichi TaxID=94029 RepID=A0A8T0FRS6_ARGBR|nr:hypothetical protein HNY73_004415 [Argiope bruennichi]
MSQIMADIGSKKSDSSKLEFSNNEITSVDDISFSFYMENNFNLKPEFLIEDFDLSKENGKISKSLNTNKSSRLSFSPNTETCEIILNSTDIKKKNAACQTENLVEIFENYSDLSDLILNLKSCDPKTTFEKADRNAIRNVKSFSSECHSSSHSIRVAQRGNEVIQLKGKNLFVLQKPANLTRELTSFKEVEYGELFLSKDDFFSTVPEEINQFQIVADDESFYLNKDETINTGINASKTEAVNKNSIQRSKVRMGLSRKQKVKPLHPYFNYKESKG